MNKMFAELTFSSPSSPGNGDENVRKVLNSFLKGFKTGDKLNLSLNKMTLEVLFHEELPLDFIQSMFENARVEKLTIAPTKGAGEAETAETEAEQETKQEAEQEAEPEVETDAETKEEAEKKAEAETEAKAEAEAEQTEAETAAEEKAAPPLKKRGRPRKTAGTTEPKATEEKCVKENFPVLTGKLGLVLPYKKMEELIEKMDVESATRPERQKKLLKDLLYGAQELRKEGRDIIVDDILVNNGISENDAAMCRMVASSWVNAYAITNGCKEKVKLEDFLNEVSQLN